MDSLRLVDVADGGDLVLMTNDGRRFSLAVDDDLRTAVRNRRPRDAAAAEGRPGPREVQSRVRAGESAEEVADSTGLDVEYVRRFEGPILAERAHVAQQARSATLERGADGDLTLESVTLEFLLAEGYGPGDVEWDSRRVEGNHWEVLADYRSADAHGHATWRFDTTTGVLEPRDDSAERITGGQRQQRRLSAVRERVFDVEQAPTTTAGTPRAARAGGGTVELLDALARQRGRRPLSTPPTPSPDASEPWAAAASDDRPEGDVPGAETDEGAFDADLPVAADGDVAVTGTVAEQGSAGGHQDAGRDQDAGPAEPEPEPEPDLLSELGLDVPRVTSSGPRPVPGADTAPADTAQVAASPVERRPSSKRRRSAVPSWDDIVFGTRRDED